MSTTTDAKKSRRYVILAACGLPFLMVMLDGTIVNVALPSIARELDATLQSLQWIVSAYILVIAALVVTAGLLADRFGRRRMLAIGVTIFTAGSILCSVTPSEEWLIAARAFQAVGGALISPSTMSIVTNTFTEKGERAKALAIWSMIASVGLAIGPMLGGALVESFGWRSIFWVNVIPGLIAFVLLFVLIPESKTGKTKAFDFGGQLLLIVFLSTLTFTIIEFTTLGWKSPLLIGAAALSLVSLVTLVFIELPKDEALIPFDLFTNRAFTSAILTLMIGVLGSAAVMFTASLYLQNFRHLSPLEAGLFMLPLAVASLVAAPVSGVLVGKGRSRAVLLVSGSLITVAGAAFWATSEGSVWLMLIPFVVMGTAFGALNDPVNVSAISELPNEKAGLAASIISMGRQVGQVLGVALAGALLAPGLGANLSKGFENASISVWILLIVAGVLVVAINVFAGLGRRPTEAAAHAGAR